MNHPLRFQHPTRNYHIYNIRYWLVEDGHKIAEADQETTIANLYNEVGVAWYYILDTTNKRFKLPRTKFGFNGIKDRVGNYIAPGLPNITGTYSCSELSEKSANVYTTGAFYDAGKHPNTNYNASGNSDGAPAMIGFDASNANSIYGNSTTVQPPATQMYLYFYVGEFSQSAAEQTAGITTEQLNSKASVEYVQNYVENYGYKYTIQD